MKRLDGVFARRQVEPGFLRFVASHSWDVAYTTDLFLGFDLSSPCPQCVPSKICIRPFPNSFLEVSDQL